MWATRSFASVPTICTNKKLWGSALLWLLLSYPCWCDHWYQGHRFSCPLWNEPIGIQYLSCVPKNGAVDDRPVSEVLYCSVCIPVICSMTGCTVAMTPHQREPPSCAMSVCNVEMRKHPVTIETVSIYCSHKLVYMYSCQQFWILIFLNSSTTIATHTIYSSTTHSQSPTHRWIRYKHVTSTE